MISKMFVRSSNYFACALIVAALVFATGCESPEDRAAGYVERAEALVEEGNLVKAELEAKNALQIEPKNPDARFILANIAEARGDFAEMAANLRAALEARPDFLEARLRLGTLYALGGMLELSEEQLAEAEKLETDTAGLRVLRARILASGGDLEAAAVELQAALEMEPDNIEAVGLFANVTAASDVGAAIAMIDSAIQKSENNQPLRILRIQLLQRSGDVDAVEQAYRELVSDFPDEASYTYQFARFLAATGKDAEVEALLNDLLERQPDNLQARLALVQYVAGRRGPEAGEALLAKFLEEQPDAHELRLVLARQYQATDREDEAIAAYQAVIAAAGNEDVALTARSRLAAIELGRGDTEAGEALIEEVLAVDSMNSDALILRGALNFDRNELKDAVSDLRSVLREEQDNERAQMLLARTHAKAEDFLLAKDAYRRALQMNPSNVEASLELTRILVSEGELGEAEKLLVEQIADAPEDVRVARALIAILVDRQRFDDALREAERVSEIPDQQAVGDFLQGGIYQLRNQDEQAIAAFKRSLESRPTAREPLQGYVASLVKLERTAEAINFLEQMGRDYPDNLYSKTLLGQVLAGSGATVEARQIFESTLTENEEWLPAYTALAGLDNADLSAQIDVYKRGLDAVPDSQELALLLGTAYERNKQYEDAISAYEKALSANPDMQAVANNLAALLADYRTDKASFERALELVSDFGESRNPAFLDTLGWVYYRLGDYARAEPLLEEAVRAADQVSVLRYHLGMNYYALGKTELARAELLAATANPDAEFAGKDEALRLVDELEAGN